MMSSPTFFTYCVYFSFSSSSYLHLSSKYSYRLFMQQLQTLFPTSAKGQFFNSFAACAAVFLWCCLWQAKSKKNEKRNYNVTLLVALLAQTVVNLIKVHGTKVTRDKKWSRTWYKLSRMFKIPYVDWFSFKKLCLYSFQHLKLMS